MARRRRLGVTPRARESTLEREGWELQRHRRAGVPPSPRLRRPAVALAEAGGPREHKKRFGQHFLEGVWVDKVIRAIDPKPDELFIEIGPGRGALTRPLVERARAVIAFEIDRDLAAALQATAPPTLTVIASDFLEPNEYLGLEAHQVPRVVRAAGNLPYYVASPILFKLVDWSREAAVPFADATVMLQREVADRLVAPPGGKEYGVLSVLIQHAAHVEIIMKLPPGAFRPAPKVHSALVRLQFHPEDPPVADRALFRAMVQAVFTRRRKTMANALLAFPPCGWLPPARALASADIDPIRRPETLSIGEFVRLAGVFASESR